jgi:hypothetical protein
MEKAKKQLFLMSIVTLGLLCGILSLKSDSFISLAAHDQPPKSSGEVINSSLGASIDESAVNAFVYVDVNGDDANDGSANAPARTVCRGIALANEKYRSGQTPKVVVRPGTYDGETCGIGGSPAVDGARPYIIEGTEAGKVIVSGSKPWTNWIGPDANGVWWKQWTNNWRQDRVAAGDGDAPNTPPSDRIALSSCTPPNGACAPLEVRLLEMIHVDGQKYYPTASYGSLQAGNFYTAENEDRVYVKPPSGVNLNAPDRLVLVVEDQKHFIYLYRDGDQAINTNLVLRNLTIAHYSGNGNPEWSFGGFNSTALFIQNLNNTLIENCRFINNRYEGLTINGNSTTVRNTQAFDNGSSGLSLGRNVGFLAEDVELRLNGKLVILYNWNGWTTGGTKILFVRDSLFRRLKVNDNFSSGFWADTGVVNTQLLDSSVNNNEREGIFQENNNRQTVDGWTNQPTLTVRNTEINFNQKAGILISEAENTLLDNVRIIGNARAVATYGGRLPECGPRNNDPFQGIYSGPCRGPLRNFAWKNSTIAATASDQKLFTFDEGGNFNDPRPWQYEIFPGLRLDAVYDTNNNRYYHPNGEAANEFFDQNGVRNKNLATWKSLHASRQNADRDSFWQAPNLPVVNGNGDGLQAVYFNDPNFTGNVISRVDATVNFDTGGNAPVAGIEPDTFSVRWTGEIQARETGVYLFRTVGDDAIRLYLDDILVASDWGATHPAQTTDSPRMYLKGGERIKVRLEYSQSYGGATARLEWKLPSQNGFAVVPQAQLYSSANAVNITDGVYKITALHSGKALDVNGYSNAEEAVVHQWSYLNQPNQQWRVESLGDGTYRLLAVHSGKALDLKNFGSEDGTPIQQFSWNNTCAQKWRLERRSDAAFTIRSNCSDKVLDVSGVSQADGAPLQIWTSGGLASRNQAFVFEPIN